MQSLPNPAAHRSSHSTGGRRCVAASWIAVPDATRVVSSYPATLIIMLKHILILLTIGAAACDSGPAITPLGVRARRSALSGEGVDASAAAHLDLTTLRAELLAADAAYADSATRTTLIEAIVAPLAADAVFLAPGAGIARGPDAARAILAANPANATSKWRWTAARGDVSSDGQHGYTFGYSEIVLENGTVLPGRYQAYWSKQTDGHWKIASYRRVARGPGAVTIEPPEGFRTPTNKHRRYFPNTDSTAEAAAVASADKAFSDLAQRVAIGEAFERYAAPTAAHT